MAALGDKDVRGLDVAMNDAFACAASSASAISMPSRSKRFQFHRAAGDAVLERLAVQKFHGDEGFARLLADVVNRADVGMIQGGRGLGFAPKALEGLRIVGDVVGQEFERDKTASRMSSALYTTPMPPPPSFSTMR